MSVIALVVVIAFVASITAAVVVSTRRAASVHDNPTVDAALTPTLLTPRGARRPM